MNKIRIIDLLNKIANGEEVPEKIMYEGCSYIWNEYEKDYERTDIDEYLFDNSIATDILNDEVEILDEPKENFTGWKMCQDGKVVCSIEGLKKEDKIEKLNTERIGKRTEQVENIESKFKWLIQDIRNMNDKINEIIDKLNNIEK